MKRRARKGRRSRSKNTITESRLRQIIREEISNDVLMRVDDALSDVYGNRRVNIDRPDWNRNMGRAFIEDAVVTMEEFEDITGVTAYDEEIVGNVTTILFYVRG